MRRAKAGHVDARISPCSRPHFCAAKSADRIKIGKAMSEHHPVEPLRLRNRILASAAIVALATAGAFGEGALTATHSAQAAPVVTSDLQAQPMPSFAPLIDRVKAAVVSVKVKLAQTSSSNGQFSNLPPGIQRFFKQFGEQNGFPNNPPSVTFGEGSGFFVSPDGYIVTNYHVVQKAKSVTVTMDSGRVLDAKVIGTDPKTDLALLKVEEPGNYPYVTFAQGQPKIGDWVVAIGNPYGLGGTVTAGIVSAEGRDIGDGPYDRFLQIDAPINKGNSGGPAFNEQGQVVGVNTAIYSPSGGSVGIGFAIPARTVEQVVDALEHGGVVERGYLGVEIQRVGPDMAEALGLKTAAGAIVDKTMPGTPAASAGLKAGDVITKVNGDEVKDAGDLTRRIGLMKPGDKVELTYLRDGTEKTAAITLASQKSEKIASLESNHNKSTATLGLDLAPASGGKPGVAVVGVDPNGAGAQKGLASGDVILDVGGKPVSSPQEVKSHIADARRQGKKAILMRVQTASGDRFVAFAFPNA
jgi:serine protease Do